MKEGKHRRKIAFRAVVVGGVLISAAAIALYTPWLGFFGLCAITVSGNQRVSADAIGRVAALERGRPLLTISLSQVASRVSSLPWIRSVIVRRSFPDTVRIHVEERVPIAWITPPDETACLLIGEGGVVVSQTCESRESLFELVGGELSGTDPGARIVDARTTRMVEFLRQAALSDMHIQRIDVSDPDSVVLEAESGLRILLGAIDSHAQRLEKLVVLSRTLDVSDYRTIDLRLEGEATLVTW